MTVAPKKSHAIFNQFPPEEQHELKQEDSQAWYNVVAVLLLIVCVGLVLATITFFATS
jgi:hypothetical protein